MAIEAIKGAGMVYQGSTSTAQIKGTGTGRDRGVQCGQSGRGLTASQGIFRR